MEPKNPWQTKTTRTAYRNPWIEIEHSEVVTPSGTDGIYGVVRFQNRATGVLALEDDWTTWLVGQWRYALGRYSWEIPEGGAPLAEDPLDGVKRELLEETGLVAQEWRELLKMHLSNSVCDEVAHVFLARDLKREAEPQFDETEDLKLAQVPFDELLERVLAGEITDAITVAATLAVERMRLSGELD